jgi:WD40 repeat protein
LATGKESVGFGTHATVTSLALSHDGRWLALGGPRNYQIELYNAETRELAMTFEGHESTVSTLAFLPDDSRLVSGGWDHTVKLWDPKSGQELLNLPMGPNPEERVEHILISPDGSQLVATDGFPEAGAGPRRTMLVWKSTQKPASKEPKP